MAEKHTIEAGDSYWDIAKKKYGGDDATINENRKRLQALNGGKALNPGDTIVLDDKPDAPTSSSKPDPKGISPKTAPAPSKGKGGLPKGIFKTPAPTRLKGMAPTPKQENATVNAQVAARKKALQAASSPDNKRTPVAGKPTLKPASSPRRDSVITGKGIMALPKSDSGSFSIVPGKKK
jgi:nucleoid-associated protein YgaU